MAGITPNPPRDESSLPAPIDAPAVQPSPASEQTDAIARRSLEAEFTPLALGIPLAEREIEEQQVEGAPTGELVQSAFSPLLVGSSSSTPLHDTPSLFFNPASSSSPLSPIRSPFHIVEPESYSIVVEKTVEFFEAILVLEGRVMTEEERAGLREFIYTLSVLERRNQANLVCSSYVELFRVLKSSLQQIGKDPSKSNEFTKIAVSFEKGIEESEKVSLQKLIRQVSSFLRKSENLTQIDLTSDNYNQTIFNIRNQLDKIESPITTNLNSEKATFHLQLERFFQMKGIRLPIALVEVKHHQELIRFLMNALLIPARQEGLFTELIREKKVNDKGYYINLIPSGETGLDEESLIMAKQELALACEDLTRFFEKPEDPFLALRIISGLSSAHWSLLDTEQRQLVEKALNFCFAAGERESEIQVERLKSTLLNENVNEVEQAIKLVRKIVTDLDLRPELKSLVQSREVDIYRTKCERLLQEQGLVTSFLKSGSWELNQPAALLASLWTEPAAPQTPEVLQMSSASSSSSSPPTPMPQQASKMALRAFRGILDIMKNPDSSEELKVLLLNNLTLWSKSTNYPKLTTDPELIALVEEISLEAEKQSSQSTLASLNQTPLFAIDDQILSLVSQGVSKSRQLALDLAGHCHYLKQGILADELSEEIERRVADPGQAITQALSLLTSSKKIATLIPLTIQELNRESRLIFSRLDLSDIPSGPTFQQIGRYGSRISNLIKDNIAEIIGREVTKKNKKKLLKVIKFFEEVAAAALESGDINMYSAIVAGLTTNPNTMRAMEAASGKSKRIRKALSRLKKLFNTVQKAQDLRSLNGQAYANYLTGNGSAPVPAVQYFATDFIQARDAHEAIRDGAVNTKLYRLEVDALNFLSDCLDHVKRALRQF